VARKFICSMSYELGPDVTDDARRLLCAELVGRRWQNRSGERLLPRNSVWIERSASDDQTADDLHQACTQDLRGAAAAVRNTGFALKVLRAWIHVSGGGTYGLAAGELSSPEE
jgi:hypothetical protein